MTPLAFVANEYNNVEDLEHGGDGGSSSFYDEYDMLSKVQGDQSNTMTPLANEYHNLEDLEYGSNGGSSSLYAYEDNMLSEEQGNQSDMGQCQEMAMSTTDDSVIYVVLG
jgi:hypothetical protein